MGKEYPADEAGKWGQEIDGISRKFQGEVRNALTEAAGRGFPAPPGPVLELIVATGLAAKFKAAEVNAKLYQGLTDRRLKEEEVDLKVVLGLAKLDLEVLKADYDNAHDLAQALEDKNLSEKRATIQKLQSDVDKRQAYIIEERANIEHEVNYWKRLAIQAEGPGPGRRSPTRPGKTQDSGRKTPHHHLSLPGDRGRTGGFGCRATAGRNPANCHREGKRGGRD